MSDEPIVEPTPSQEPATTPTPEPATPATPAAEPVLAVPPAEPAVTPEPEPTAEPPNQVPDRVVPGASEYKLPEGMDPGIGTFANENGFTQEQLDASLGHFGSIIIANKTAEKESIQALGTQQIAEWGADADANLKLANRALTVTDTEGELTKVLNDSGMGSHPAVLKHFLMVGNKLKEGGFLKGELNTPKNASDNLAHRMYPNNVPKTQGD